MYRTSQCLALTFAFALCLSSASSAATPEKSMKTTITLKVLSCEGCAKRVREKLSSVRGVDAVTTDLKTKSAVVTPKGETKLSPRQLWEAVEKAGKTPVKLRGPSGSFTSKPKS